MRLARRGSLRGPNRGRRNSARVIELITPVGAGDHEIFKYSELPKLARDLERAHEPAGGAPVRGHGGDIGAVEADRPRIRRGEPGDDTEQRGLAGTVRTDEAGHRAFGKVTVQPSSAVRPP